MGMLGECGHKDSFYDQSNQLHTLSNVPGPAPKRVPLGYHWFLEFSCKTHASEWINNISHQVNLNLSSMGDSQAYLQPLSLINDIVFVLMSLNLQGPYQQTVVGKFNTLSHPQKKYFCSAFELYIAWTLEPSVCGQGKMHLFICFWGAYKALVEEVRPEVSLKAFLI